jgi:hypothetical protein
MAASFTAAAIFDAVALIVIAIAIRMRQPGAAGAPASQRAEPAEAGQLTTEVLEADILEAEVM